MTAVKRVIFVIFALLLILCSLAVLLFGSSQQGEPETQEMETIQETQKVEEINGISIGRDFPATNELVEMVNNAELIVVGAYVSFASSWNMARSSANVLHEDERNYTEGHLYAFHVEEVLKGSINDASILVNHLYSEKMYYTESNAVVDERGVIIIPATEVNELSFTVRHCLYIEPEIGMKYILFLSRDSHFGNYYGAIEPFSIRVDGSIVTLQSNLINGEGYDRQIVSIDNSDRVLSVGQGGLPVLTDTISGRAFDDIKEEISEILQ